VTPPDLASDQVPAFDQFVGIDWSGAVGRYDGIAIAVCEAGDTAPALVPPPGGRRWTRTQAAHWIAETARGDRRALIGIDCAFSMPFAKAGFFVRENGGAFDLWALVEEVCAAVPDFHGATFALDPRFASSFWAKGKRPRTFFELRRATEAACRVEGSGVPETPFKLFGPKTVGPGTLAGMRVLHHLRQTVGHRIAIWPFDPPAPGRTVLAEIFPRMFWRRAGLRRNTKVREGAAVAAALAALGCAAPAMPDRLTDHQADALVTAAGLRHVASDPRTWAPPSLTPRIATTEGWILGVRGSDF
jgi:hypothetical protein